MCIRDRFRGDPKLFAPGVAFLEKRTRKPCLGVIPYLPDLGLDEEDGVALARRAPAWPDDGGRHRRLRIAVVHLPRISNFTDFAPLDAEPSVALAFAGRPADLRGADVVILPGTKQTLDDLEWLRGTGLARAIGAHAKKGPVIGICGGMQMLGASVADPHAMEGGGRRQGLGLLPIRTTLDRTKVTRRATATLRQPKLFGRRCAAAARGYEIHLGSTRYDAGAGPLLRLRREGDTEDVADGAADAAGRVIGTYMHGFFDDDGFRHEVVRALRAAAGLAAPRALSPYTADREARFDRLARHVRRSLDVRTIESWLR